MRKPLLLLLTLLFSLHTFSTTVQSQHAKQVATNGWLEKTGTAGIAAWAYTHYYRDTITHKDTIVAYFFDIVNPKNVSDTLGFIEVSAEYKTAAVLGFSTEHKAFHKPTRRDPFNAMLYSQHKAITHAQNMDVGQNTGWAPLEKHNFKATEKATAPVTVDSVNGLLGTIAYNQEPYYNGLCPMVASQGEQCVTGCVANAMAQIMKFWGWPLQGTGSISYCDCSANGYTNNFGTLTDTFNYSYPWSSMPNSINTWNVPIERLEKDCGYAVAMDYGDDSQDGSGAEVLQSDAGAGNPCAQQAYWKYFGFKASITGVYQASYTAAAWQALIITELKAGRPIQYAGFGNAGGHTWVADGYRLMSDGTFYVHMNWGWGGADNGWFLLNNLDPAGFTFNTGDEMLIGIQPNGSPATSCSGPTTANVTNITQTSCTYSWNGADSSYNVQCMVLPNGTWTAFKTTANTINIPELPPASTIDIQVNGVCKGGAVSGSIGNSFNTVSPPCGVSTALTVNSITGTTVNTSWTPGTVNTGWYASWTLDAGGQYFKSPLLTTPSYQITGLTAKTVYDWYVIDECPFGQQSNTPQSSFTTSGVTPPACNVANGLSVSGITYNSATLGWTGVSGATSYNIQYRPSTTSSWTLAAATSNSLPISNLPSSTKIYFEVQTVCASGSSSYSYLDSLTTLVQPCQAPSTFTAGTPTTTTETISWTAVPGAISYNFLYKLNSASVWNTVSVTAASASLSGLLPDSVYNYKAQTVCSGGASGYSAVSSFTTPAVAPPPPPVSYCPLSGNNTYEYLQTVIFNGDTFAIGKVGYKSDTSIVIPLKTSGIPVSAIFGYSTSTRYPEQFTIWIDVNKDGQFESTSERYYWNQTTGFTTGNTNPIPMFTGVTDMRVIMGYDDASSTCNPGLDYGTAVDFHCTISTTATKPRGLIAR